MLRFFTTREEGDEMSTKRLRQRAHQAVPKDAERLTLAPLTFEQALKGALATKLPETDTQDEEAEKDS
jgi:hypothetical protein